MGQVSLAARVRARISRKGKTEG